MSLLAAKNHRKRPRPAGSISMTARLRPPPCAHGVAAPAGVEEVSLPLELGEQPRLEAERRQGFALGDRGERQVSGRCRGRPEDAEVDAGGDVGIAQVPEDVLDHAVMSVPVDGAARPVFSAVVDGQQRSRVGALEGLEDERGGPSRIRVSSPGPGRSGCARSVRRATGSIGVKTSTRASPATATRTSRGPSSVPRTRRKARLSRSSWATTMPAPSAGMRSSTVTPSIVLRIGSSPGTALDRDGPDGQIVEVFEHAGGAACRRPRRPRSGGTGRSRPSRSQIWRTASATKAPNTGYIWGLVTKSPRDPTGGCS